MSPHKPIPKKCLPTRPRRGDKVPRRAPAVIALFEMGIHDYAAIGEAVGLSANEVQQIDSAEDPRIKRLASLGTPPETHFPLARPIRCPSCGRRITLAPCVACRSDTLPVPTPEEEE